MTHSTDKLLAQLLAECSEQIIAGMSVDACLARHPEHATELAPLLAAVTTIRQLHAAPVRDPLAAAHTRAQFLAAAQSLARERQRPPVTWAERIAAWWRALVAPFARSADGWAFPRAVPSAVFAMLLVVILAGALTTGAVSASGTALPGDFLYPLKTFTEQAQRFVTRDATARQILEQNFARRRLDEAKAVVDQNRRVSDLALTGTLDAYDAQAWIVSGLRILIGPDSRIEGQPFRGAAVRGRVTAPGDGTLIALILEIVEATSESAPASPFTPTAVAPTVTPTPSPTATSWVQVRSAADPLVIDSEPRHVLATATRSQTLTPTAVATATRTPRPTATPRPTRGPTVTMAATSTPSRPEKKTTVLGRVTDISDDRWTVNGVTFRVSGETKFIGDAGLGWLVRADLRIENDGSYTALLIKALEPPDVRVPVQFTDILQAQGGEWWTIGSARVKVTGQTSLEGDPQVGDLVTMTGERLPNGEIWALSIVVVPLPETEFEGTIEQVGGGYLIVDGRRIDLDGNSRVIGEPAAGRRVHVRARRYPDGQLIAVLIKVLASPTETPTLWPTPTVTPTVPEPTVTPTPPEPTVTPTPPEPTVTPTAPEPTVTPTPPEPTVTPTAPEPVVTPSVTSAAAESAATPSVTPAATDGSAPADPTTTSSPLAKHPNVVCLKNNAMI